MSERSLLKVIRSICLIQFCCVLFLSLRHGITREESGLVAVSFVFGLIFDAFAHTFLQYHRAHKARQKLDSEFNQLIRKAEEHQPD